MNKKKTRKKKEVKEEKKSKEKVKTQPTDTVHMLFFIVLKLA